MSESIAPYTSVGYREVSAGREAFEFIGGDLVEDSIEELILYSLFTWARAGDDDPLPAGASREGWFADPGMGSRLYQLARAKLTTQTLVDAKQYAEEALAWLVADGVLASVSATATKRADNRGIDLAIEYRPPKGPTRTARYAYLTETA